MTTFMQIEAIIFDIGGVIWLPPEAPLSAKWAARCGLDAEAFDNIVYGSQWGEQALIGAVTREEIWANIGQSLALSGDDLQELEQDYWHGIWDTELLDYVRTLKPKYKLGIISDAYTDARKMVREWVNEELFDVIVFSAEEGIHKPDPRIYQRALQRLDVAAETAVFIDDRAHNVAGAKQLGMHAFQYQGLAHLKNTLNNYLGS
jgi:putative hydrolase of the HAD superfamily